MAIQENGITIVATGLKNELINQSFIFNVRVEWKTVAATK